MWDFCYTFTAYFFEIEIISYSYKKHLLFLVTLLVNVAGGVSAQSSGYPELDAMVQTWKDAQQTTFGYPASQESNLALFYQWYLASGMDVVNLNNSGDPMTDNPSTLSTQKFERQVIEFFALLIRQNDRTYNATGTLLK